MQYNCKNKNKKNDKIGSQSDTKKERERESMRLYIYGCMYMWLVQWMEHDEDWGILAKSNVWFSFVFLFYVIP